MNPPIQTLRHVFWESTAPMRVLTILMYPVAAFGLWAAWVKQTPDSHLMYHLLPGVPDFCHAWLWGLVVAYIFIARVIGIFIWEGKRFTRRTTPMFGVIFWSMLLASSAADHANMAFAPLFGIAALVECWILSRAWLES
jgi:hypothetical protein